MVQLDTGDTTLAERQSIRFASTNQRRKMLGQRRHVANEDDLAHAGIRPQSFEQHWSG